MNDDWRRQVMKERDALDADYHADSFDGGHSCRESALPI
jgi:hypothetical protein